MERYLRRAVFVIVGALLATPLVVVDGFFFPFIVPRYVAFRILVELLVLAWLALRLVQPGSYRIRLGWVGWAAVAYLASAIISGLAGYSWTASLWGNFERMEGLFTMAHYVALLLVLPALIRREDWPKVLAWSVAVSVAVSLYGLAQKLGLHVLESGRDRISATIGNPAYVAGYLLFQMGFAAWLWLRARGSTLWRWLYGAAFAIQLVTFVYTLTRGAILGLLASVVFLGALGLWRGTPTLRRRSLVALGVVILGVVLVVALRNTPLVRNVPVLSRFAEINLQANTAQTRFWTWGSAWQGIAERPVLGWGPENFQVVFNRHFNANHYRGIGSETWFDHAHNMVLDVAVSQGAVGLLAWLALIAGMGYLAWRRFRDPATRTQGVVGLALLVAYFVQNLVLFDVLVVWLMLGVLASWLAAGQPAAQASEKARLGGTAMAVGCVVFVAWLLPVNVRTAMDSHRLITALSQAHSGYIVPALDTFQQLLEQSRRTGWAEIARRQGLVTFDLLTSGANQQLPKDVIDRAYRQSAEALERAVASYGYDQQNDLLLAKLHVQYANLTGDASYLEKSEQVLQQALDRAPNRIETRYDLGLTLLIAGRNDEAIEQFTKIVELTNRLPESLWNLGFAYLVVEQYPPAVQSMEEALAAGYDLYNRPPAALLPQLRRLAVGYAQTGQLDKLRGVYERLVDTFASLNEANSSSAQFIEDYAGTYSALADTYRQLGDYANARVAAEEAARINPAVQAQAQEFINALPKS